MIGETHRIAAAQSRERVQRPHTRLSRSHPTGRDGLCSGRCVPFCPRPDRQSSRVCSRSYSSWDREHGKLVSCIRGLRPAWAASRKDLQYHCYPTFPSGFVHALVAGLSADSLCLDSHSMSADADRATFYCRIRLGHRGDLPNDEGDAVAFASTAAAPLRRGHALGDRL